MGRQQGSAFITTRKGFCYLTIKCAGRNFHIKRIRNYTLEAEDKRFMRRLYPDVTFDWKKIAQQLAEKREVCRRYRSRRRNPDTTRPARERGPLYAVYEPGTRTVYTDGDMGNALPLLDVILQMDRARDASPSPALLTVAKKPTRKSPRGYE